MITEAPQRMAQRSEITAMPGYSTGKPWEELAPRQITAIHSSHILHDELQTYIAIAIILPWLLLQMRRIKSTHLNAGCWYGWDGLGLALVSYLCQSQRWALACIFTASFVVWTRLPGSPLNEIGLPTFSEFIKTSQGRAMSLKSEHAASSLDTPGCIVCWSSDPAPVDLPCFHQMCVNCLTAMKERQQAHCPMCRLVLFRANTSLQVAIHKAVIATFAARLTAQAICLLLQLRHEEYWEVLEFSATYIPQFYCFRVLYIVASTHGVAWWRGGLFWYLLPIPSDRLHSGLWKSAWPPAVFVFLFSLNVLSSLAKIARLDLVVERVVHHPPFTGLYRQ